MIDYETFCKIRDCHDRQGLTIAQTARALGLDPRDGRHVAERVRISSRGVVGRAAVCWTPSSRASPGCWIPTPIVLNKSFSVCARRDTAAA